VSKAYGRTAFLQSRTPVWEEPVRHQQLRPGPGVAPSPSGTLRGLSLEALVTSGNPWSTFSDKGLLEAEKSSPWGCLTAGRSRLRALPGSYNGLQAPPLTCTYRTVKRIGASCMQVWLAGMTGCHDNFVTELELPRLEARRTVADVSAPAAVPSRKPGADEVKGARCERQLIECLNESLPHAVGLAHLRHLAWLLAERQDHFTPTPSPASEKARRCGRGHASRTHEPRGKQGSDSSYTAQAPRRGSMLSEPRKLASSAPRAI
jgi:hypothetical protein